MRLPGWRGYWGGAAEASRGSTVGLDAREVRGMTLGGGTPTGVWLARFSLSRWRSLSTSCNAEHVAVRRAYVRHDYAFTPLPLPLCLVPDCAPSFLTLTFLLLYPRPRRFPPPSPGTPPSPAFILYLHPPQLPGELSARASDFSVLLALIPARHFQ